jgi:hypothetical protein
MGKFFNTEVKGEHKIKTNLEKERKQYNETLGSKKGQQEGVVYPDGGNEGKSEPDILLAEE